MIFKKYSWISVGASIIISTTVIGLFGIRYTIDKISLKESSKPKIISSINNIEALDDRLKELKNNKIPPNGMPLIKDDRLHKKDMPSMPAGFDKNIKPTPQPMAPGFNSQMPSYPPPPYGGMPPFGPPIDPSERKLIEEEMNRRREMMEQYGPPPPYMPSDGNNQMPYPPPYYAPPPYFPEYETNEDYEEEDYDYENERFNDNSSYKNSYQRANNMNDNEKDFYEYESDK